MARKRKPRLIDLFCGAGGLSKGFEMAGFKTLLGIDSIQRFTETFQLNHTNSKTICGDITKITVDEIKKIINNLEVDVIVGGPPCQGFSMAGQRDPKDPRNSLFMEYVRIVEGLKPTYFVMENVPGILTMETASGQNVLSIILTEFKRLGYTVEYKKLLASDYGVPQKRKRIIFIGTNKNKKIHFPKPTHSEINAEGLFEPPLKKWKPVKEVLFKKNEVEKSYFHSKKMIEGFIKRTAVNRKKGNGFGWQILDLNKPSYTISARYWKDGSDALVKYSETEIRMLTPRECARIQTFPDTFKFVGNKKEQYMQIGNAVPPLLGKAIAESILEQII
ncbi:MAG TPA: DNA cytosine methyltransferase [Ignavibacteria bacterium]|nr:DNA cytosine methyltransferase [Ignavibacteria bacterium]